MTKRRKGKSLLRQETGRRNIQMFNLVMRDEFPRCGAKAKSTGQPCRRFAMANGRCDRHGGKTPSKEGWHRPRWPKKNAPDAEMKLNRKLDDLDRAYKKREKRLAAMTAEQRAKYDKWLLGHPPGSKSARQATKERRRQNAEARAGFAQTQTEPRPMSPELEKLEELIADLEMKKLILERGSVFD